MCLCVKSIITLFLPSFTGCSYAKYNILVLFPEGLIVILLFKCLNLMIEDPTRKLSRTLMGTFSLEWFPSCACIHTYMFLSICLSIYTYVYMHMCMQTCAYLCVCIYISCTTQTHTCIFVSTCLTFYIFEDGNMLYISSILMTQPKTDQLIWNIRTRYHYGIL